MWRDDNILGIGLRHKSIKEVLGACLRCVYRDEAKAVSPVQGLPVSPLHKEEGFLQQTNESFGQMLARMNFRQIPSALQASHCSLGCSINQILHLNWLLCVFWYRELFSMKPRDMRLALHWIYRQHGVCVHVSQG